MITEFSNYMKSGEMDTPDVCVEAKKLWIPQEQLNSGMNGFIDDFEITNNDEDFITSASIKEWLNEKSIGLTQTKFGIELKKYCTQKRYFNVVNKKKKIKGKNLMCWFGIKSTVTCEQCIL